MNRTPRYCPPFAGERYDSLTAVEEVERDRHGHRRWAFQCDCGRTTIYPLAQIHYRRRLGWTAGCLRCYFDAGGWSALRGRVKKPADGAFAVDGSASRVA